MLLHLTCAFEVTTLSNYTLHEIVLVLPYKQQAIIL